MKAQIQFDEITAFAKKPGIFHGILHGIIRGIFYSISFAAGFPVAIVCSLLFGKIYYRHTPVSRGGIRVCSRCGCVVTRINERKQCHGK